MSDNHNRLMTVRQRYDQRSGEMIREIMPTQYQLLSIPALTAGTAGQIMNTEGITIMGSGTQGFLIAYNLASSSQGNNFNNVLAVVVNSSTYTVLINASQGAVLQQAGHPDAPLAYIPPSSTLSIVALNAGTYSGFATIRLEQTGANVEA